MLESQCMNYNDQSNRFAYSKYYNIKKIIFGVIYRFIQNSILLIDKQNRIGYEYVFAYINLFVW